MPMNNPFSFLRKTQNMVLSETPQRTVDVTARMFDIDLAAVGVVAQAPVIMTGTERLLLYALALALRPERYLEIGTAYGGSAMIVASAMDAANSAGQLVCIDPAPQITPEIWQRLAQRTTLVTGRSPDILPAAAEAAGGPFDLVLIDGWHTCESVLADAEGVWPLVANGAYLLFHDSHNQDVSHAIDRFIANHQHEIADVGTLSREFTTESTSDGQELHWAGLRLLQVQR